VPHFQNRGVATALVGVAEEVAAVRGFDDVQLRARAELPATVTFWRRRGYAELARTGAAITMGKALPVEIVAATPGEARAVGRRIAALARAGDVVLLVGELGAGKTTLTQGIGEGLRVRGPVTSPTFVICRLHPSTTGGPSLVHVDAYRLGDAAELDDADIDGLVGNAVTVVEWGEGIAEALSDDRLRVRVARPHGAESTAEREETRVITVTPVGARWVGARVRSSVIAQGGAKDLTVASRGRRPR
jgi:tRNA threonylcarbamoyladenosine biosynthesis protein TsaE